MKISDVMNCCFSAWYSKFKDHTIKSAVLPLPQEFVDYLLADMVVLPEGTTAEVEVDPEDNRNSDELIDWTTEDTVTPVAEQPSFPEFEASLKRAIQRLGGRVFPKLNWSAPKDATWISFDKTLKCTCPSDVYLLLKSSDFISHDLTQPFHLCEEDENQKQEVSVTYELVLRKWQEINPANELRCFVKDNRVIGISQRHTDMCYGFSTDDTHDIVADVQSFFYHVIKGNFPDKTFCFDVYRRRQGKLLLLDFNPFGAVTDSLLFTWEELESDSLHTHTATDDSIQTPTEARDSIHTPTATSDNIHTPTEAGDNPQSPEHQAPVFRCIQTPSGVQPNPYSAYGMPRDFIDISSGEDPHKLMDLLQAKMEQERHENPTGPSVDDEGPDVDDEEHHQNHSGLSHDDAVDDPT